MAVRWCFGICQDVEEHGRIPGKLVLTWRQGYTAPRSRSGTLPPRATAAWAAMADAHRASLSADKCSAAGQQGYQSCFVGFDCKHFLCQALCKSSNTHASVLVPEHHCHSLRLAGQSLLFESFLMLINKHVVEHSQHGAAQIYANSLATQELSAAAWGTGGLDSDAPELHEDLVVSGLRLLLAAHPHGDLLNVTRLAIGVTFEPAPASGPALGQGSIRGFLKSTRAGAEHGAPASSSCDDTTQSGTGREDVRLAGGLSTFSGQGCHSASTEVVSLAPPASCPSAPLAPCMAASDSGRPFCSTGLLPATGYDQPDARISGQETLQTATAPSIVAAIRGEATTVSQAAQSLNNALQQTISASVEPDMAAGAAEMAAVELQAGHAVPTASRAAEHHSASCSNEQVERDQQLAARLQAEELASFQRLSGRPVSRPATTVASKAGASLKRAAPKGPLDSFFQRHSKKHS